jgi:integrase
MKKKRAHIIPLTKQAISILEEIKPLSGIREHVFPADRKPKLATNAQTATMALKRMGYGGVLTAHGMRSIASTLLNEQGFDPSVIEAALAHSDKDKVRSAYNRAEYFERRVKLMAYWSEYIEQAATGQISGNYSIKPIKVVK